jgi:hypothetical protein
MHGVGADAYFSLEGKLSGTEAKTKKAPIGAF